MHVAKGYIVATGGAEDKAGNKESDHKESNDLDFYSEGILKKIQELLTGKEPIIEVITTASSDPDESFENYKKAFKKLDVHAHHLKNY